jgi:hypothetical protein
MSEIGIARAVAA